VILSTKNLQRRVISDGWPTSLEVGNSIGNSRIVPPTAKAMGQPLFRSLTVAALFGFALLLIVGCKPEDNAPPPTPTVAPLAGAKTATRPSAQAQLPPGHPPIDGGAAPAPKQDDSGQLPPGHPPIDAPSGKAQMPQSAPSAEPAGEPAKGGEVEVLAGIKLTTPAGWVPLELKSTGGAFSIKPAAAFSLPKVEGDDEDASVRVTHFPGMKNVPAEAQLNRWYNQFSQPDGKATKDVAIAQSFVLGDATVTLADIPGTMGAGPSAKPNYRLVAAIIEHPKGPHFVKVTGPTKTIDKWKDSIVEYVKSVEVTP